MKNDHQELLKDPLVDLYYPSKQKREECRARSAARRDFPKDFSANLSLEQLAAQISNYYSKRILDILSEFCCDKEVIEYRLDVLEDFRSVPKLSSTVKKTVDIMLENDRKNVYKLSNPDSFSMLSEALEAYEAYISCMELLHEFYAENKPRLRSRGVIGMFEYFEEQLRDPHFAELKKQTAELRAMLKDRIRSVTVAINLDETLVPVSAGILELSKEPYILKPSLLDRIIYHGANFQSGKVIKSVRNKYTGLNTDGEPNLNTADKALFDELAAISDSYVQKLCDVLEEYQKITLKDMYSISYQLDFYLGAIDMINLCESAGMKMCRPVISDGATVIKGLFDPIYFREARTYNMRAKEKDRKPVVLNDISFGEDADFYILTGANNGGKTTFVRAVGICFAMAQAGLYVPAESCTIRPADYIYTHFPKEEQTGINASRFTTEIKQFKTISETVTDNSLLFMNESIQSTTPGECVDIAYEMVRIFTGIGVRGIFATHLPELAERIDELNQSGVRSKLESLTVLTDEQTGERKYKVVKGKPSRTSHARTILDEFGISYEQIAKRLKKQ
ncbi:MAG: DNA mismatch repair protein MutS [Ruminococcus sp.]|nr:DNA mismatch repair protein MutS [Ruminococcus sp.]